MSNIDRQLAKAHPSLRQVSPLAFWIVLIFGVFNIVLGASLVLGVDATRFTTPLLIVNEVFTYDIWGGIFIVIGLIKIYSLYAKDFKLSRTTMLVGVVIKASWAIALTVRIFVNPGTYFLTLIWVALAAIQIVTVIFFMPPAERRQVGRIEAVDE